MFLCANDIPILESFARGDTCSKTSVELWMMSVFLKAPAEDGCLEFNHYEQSRLFDMRVRAHLQSDGLLSDIPYKMNVLNLCFAQLELNYEYIRATTPMYSIFNFTPMSEQARRVIESSNSGPATYVRMASRKKSTGTYEVVTLFDGRDHRKLMPLQTLDRCCCVCVRSMLKGRTGKTDIEMGNRWFD
jgi:hypothetical protein